MSETEAIAKAIEKSAEFGTQSLKTSEKLGGFFSRVFKEPVAEAAGMLTDRLRFVRWKHLADIADQVNVILTQRGVEDTRAVTPKLALPIFEESSLEDDPALMDLWAQLLANAMDPAFKGELRYAYTEIIKNLSPIDAKILSTIYELARQQHRNTIKLAGTVGVQSWRIVKDLNISEADYEVSASNLMRLRCISPCLIPVRLGDGFKMNRNETLTIDKGSSTVVLTPLGVTFLEACGTPQSIPAPAFSVAQGVAVAGTVELSSSGILVE